jgi:GR25 family glycosyltransferase involved in LPS biosynthesis|tara:strand:+ start:2749 stop:3633 length:885 start_codon:yes stop_codon:yes gene_type:complete
MIKIDFKVDIIYVLNLKRHKKRKQRIIDLFKKHGIENYEFVEAIPGGQLPLDKNRIFDYKKLINDGILNEWFADPNGMLTKNIIACAWSHLKIYEKFVKTEHETCLILEDDVIFSPRLYEYVLDGRFDKIKYDIEAEDVGIFHWGKQQMDEIEFAKKTEYSIYLFPRNTSPQSAQAYQINKWTANYLIEIGYPIKKAADVLLDHAKVKVNCPQHSLLIQHNGDIKKSNLDRLTKAIWTEHSEEEFESTTSVELFKGAMNCVIECNIGIDTVRFRNYKTEEGALLKNYPILYFKE